MGILDAVHEFCLAHNITYSLSSGTLIGAVRHKGYIPWDDDIDIYMMRDDYERFLTTFSCKDNTYRVLDPQKEKHYYYTFAKVVDTRTMMMEEEVDGYNIGVYIDVFPIDYVTEYIGKREKTFKLKRLLYKIRRCKISKKNYLRSALAYYCYKYLPVTVKMIEAYIKRLTIQRKPTSMLCNMSEAGPSAKGCFPAADFASVVDIAFEDRTYKAMVGYEDYLTRVYGNYMQLPPEDQRQTHAFKAYML